jgi:hypothetical protein
MKHADDIALVAFLATLACGVIVLLVAAIAGS